MNDNDIAWFRSLFTNVVDINDVLSCKSLSNESSVSTPSPADVEKLTLISEQMLASLQPTLRRRVQAMMQISLAKQLTGLLQSTAAASGSSQSQSKTPSKLYLCTDCAILFNCDPVQHAKDCEKDRCLEKATICESIFQCVLKSLMNVASDRAVNIVKLLRERADAEAASDEWRGAVAQALRAALTQYVRERVLGEAAASVTWSEHRGVRLTAYLRSVQPAAAPRRRPAATTTPTTTSTTTSTTTPTTTPTTATATTTTSPSTTPSATTSTPKRSSPPAAVRPVDALQALFDDNDRVDAGYGVASSLRLRSPTFVVALLRLKDKKTIENLLLEACKDDSVSTTVANSVGKALRSLAKLSLLGEARNVWPTLAENYVWLCELHAEVARGQASALAIDVAQVHQWCGRDFERSSSFGGHFALHCLFEHQAACERYWRGLDMPGAFSQPLSSTVAELKRRVSAHVVDQRRRTQRLLSVLLRGAESHHHTVLTWFAALFQLNELRVSAADSRDAMRSHIEQMAASEPFLLNAAAVCVALAQPSSLDTRAPSLVYAAGAPRFTLDQHAALCASSRSPTAVPSAAPRLAEFPLDSELFFAALHALHVGFAPSFRSLINWQGSVAHFSDVYAEHPTLDVKQQLTLLRETWYSHQAMLDDNLLSSVVSLSAAILQWLATKANDDNVERAASLFASLPAFLVRDAADCLTMAAQHRRRLLAACPDTIVGSLSHLTVLASKPRLVARPPIRGAVVAAIGELAWPRVTAFVLQRLKASVIASERRLDSLLLRAVRNDATMQQWLLPGLMDVYVSAGIVEGLDVDKENFDKYSVRRGIADTLIELWKLPEYTKEIRKIVLSNGTKQHQQALNFVSTSLGDLLHLLDDVFGRLTNVCQLQKAMADRRTWNKQSLAARRQRERYLSGEGHVARSFYGLATGILSMLTVLARQATPLFLHASNLPKCVTLVLHTFRALCDTSASAEINVRDPAQFGFIPSQLLLRIADLCVLLSSSQQFVEAVAADYEFEPITFQLTLDVIKRNRIVDQRCVTRLTNLLSLVEARLGGSSNLDDIALSAGGTPLRNEVLFDDADVADADDNDMNTSPSTTTSSSSTLCNNNNNNNSNNNDNTNNNNNTINDLKQLDNEELSQKYVAQLSERRFDAINMRSPDGQWRHHFASNIAALPAHAGGQKRLARIMEEFATLGEDLPLTVGSSIFVRCDEERIDVLKAMITGPADTPYSGGLFLFDIFFPAEYPNVPPLVNLETTGNGTVRFNPNLYNCGKVCLSLLGTWHGGGDRAAKWNASHSTLQQVLVSIQGLILIEQPYFNEPAYEASRGTTEGDRNCRLYNETLRLATARHALLTPARVALAAKESGGAFDDVVVKHLLLQRARLAAQLQRWVDESSSASSRAKMARVARDLDATIAQLSIADIDPQ